MPDLDAALDFYENRLGASPFMVFRGPELEDETFHGTPCKPRQDLAFGYVGHLQFELICPTDGGDESSYTQFLDRHPGGGIHHTAMVVERLETGLQAIGLSEDDVIQHGRFGADTRFAYVEAPGTGALLELIQLDGPTHELFDSLRRGKPAVTR